MARTGEKCIDPGTYQVACGHRTVFMRNFGDESPRCPSCLRAINYTKIWELARTTRRGRPAGPSLADWSGAAFAGQAPGRSPI
jgi:hypothetical protein